MRKKAEGTNIKKNQCHICDKIVNGGSYKFKSHLYQHSLVESRFVCSYCSKEYFRRDAFERHVAIHTRQKKFYCDYCCRGYVDKRNLINHLHIHDDYFKRPKNRYNCMVCGMSYCEERLLKYHIRKQHFNLHAKKTTHDTKKPNETWIESVMQSEVCVEMTKVDDNTIIIKRAPTIKKTNPSKKTETTMLHDYINSVFGNTEKSQYSKAVCDYCNKEMLKKSLQPHIREAHLKLKRFKCEVCNNCFNRRYQLVDHICGKVRRRKVK